ncbi:ABC transporter substrate-binding protein, partial [Escherichia coli]|nr:ABC transporter substrate-binding protein [Escherichia coli]
YGQYVRNQSFFDRSPLAATGMPGPDELKMLEPLRASVPPEVFGPMLVQPSTVAPSSQRDNLKRARDLLAQ